jgi:two-component system NtrC family sensor kinase
MCEQTRILCVDDERNVLRALERIFLDDDYLILTASSAEEGLEMLRAAPQVQVVISDFRMPGMNGVEFLKEVSSLRPDSIRIVLSGYADTAAVVAAINEGKIYKFIPKPWNDDELRVTVANAVETFTMHRRNLELTEELRLKNEELKELNASLEQLVGERTRELQQQNRDLVHARNVLNSLPVGVLGLATDGAILHINREAALLLGVRAEEVTGQAMFVALPQLRVLAGKVAGDACGCRPLTVNGVDLQAKAVTVIEEGQVGVVVTISKVCAGS